MITYREWKSFGQKKQGQIKNRGKVEVNIKG